MCIEMRVKRDPNIPLFEFVENPDKKLAASTLKNYKKYLNNITELSYLGHQQDERVPLITKRKDIYDNPKMVVKLIKAHTDNRRVLCGYYSAIFYSLGRQDLEKDTTILPIVQEFRKTYYNETYQAKLKEQGELD